MSFAKYTTEDRAEWEKMKAEGYSYDEIAKKYGAARDTVYRHFGPESGKTYKNRKSPVVITPEKVEEMKIYQELGLSHSQIAIEMGLSKITVQRHLGKQRESNKAAYGSLSAHATGDSFAPKGFDLMKAKEERMDQLMEEEAKHQAGKEEQKAKLLEDGMDTLARAVKSAEKIVAIPKAPLQVSLFSMKLTGSICDYEITNDDVSIRRNGNWISVGKGDAPKLLKEMIYLAEMLEKMK